MTPAQETSKEEPNTDMLMNTSESNSSMADCVIIPPPTPEIPPIVLVGDSVPDKDKAQPSDSTGKAIRDPHLEWLQRISLIDDYTNSNYNLVAIDLDIDRLQRQASIVSRIDDKKEKGVSLDENEVFIHWRENPRMGDRHQVDFTQKKHREKLETFNVDTRCPSFPLVPDFSGSVEDPTSNLMDLNTANQDRDRTLQQVSETRVSHTTETVIPPKRLPVDIRKKMWPTAKDSDSTTDNSDADKPQTAAAKVDLTPTNPLVRNLELLRKRPLNREKLAKLRERVTRDFKDISIEEPAVKKQKPEPIVWDEGKQDLREVIEGKIKSLRLSSDTSSEEKTTPVKKPRLDDWIKEQHEIPPSRRVIRIIKRTRHTPLPDTSQEGQSHIKSEPQERQKLVANRRQDASRRCRICGEGIKNLRCHVCLAHLGRKWWGIMGDITCWNCHRYNKPSDITKCGGSYIPLFHRRVLIARHTDFINHLKEEFGVRSDNDLLNKIQELGLNSRVASDFTDREVVFLEILDAHYGYHKKSRYSARYPTRIVEILHWKTLMEIEVYLKEAGRIRGTRFSTYNASLVDTRCDLITLKAQESHNDYLAIMPYIQPELKLFNLQIVIGEIHNPTTPIVDMMLLLKDPMVRISLGVSPQHAHDVKRGYYMFCIHQIRDNSVVAIGGLGIDSKVHTTTVKDQMQVMKDFIAIAKPRNKAIRLLSTGDVSTTLEVAKSELSREHPVHLLNYSGSPEGLTDFFSYFNHGYIGISSKVTNPDQNLLRTIRQTPLKRIVLESNCPHQSTTFHTKSRPTDVAVVLDTIARIKMISPSLVSRIIRSNITDLYHF